MFALGDQKVFLVGYEKYGTLSFYVPSWISVTQTGLYFVFQLSEGQKLSNPNLGKLVLLRTKNGQLMALPAAQFQQLQQQQQQQKLQADGGMPPRASSAPPPPQTQILQTYQQQSSSRPGIINSVN